MDPYQSSLREAIGAQTKLKDFLATMPDVTFRLVRTQPVFYLAGIMPATPVADSPVVAPAAAAEPLPSGPAPPMVPGAALPSGFVPPLPQGAPPGAHISAAPPLPPADGLVALPTQLPVVIVVRLLTLLRQSDPVNGVLGCRIRPMYLERYCSDLLQDLKDADVTGTVKEVMTSLPGVISRKLQSDMQYILPAAIEPVPATAPSVADHGRGATVPAASDGSAGSLVQSRLRALLSAPEYRAAGIPGHTVKRAYQHHFGVSLADDVASDSALRGFKVSELFDTMPDVVCSIENTQPVFRLAL